MSKQKIQNIPDFFSNADLKSLEKYLNCTSGEHFVSMLTPKDFTIMQFLRWEIGQMKYERPNLHPDIITIVKCINMVGESSASSLDITQL